MNGHMIILSLGVVCHLFHCTYAQVDGNWGDWSQYGACSPTCSDNGGIQTRTRACNNPAPSDGGKTCFGSNTQTQSCSVNKCPVDGNWGDWSQYGACSPTCSDNGGIQTRTRACNNPAPSDGGKTCFGSNTQTQSCSVNKCPVDGNWGDWSQYGACSPTCSDNGGIQTRTRACNNPAPSDGGKTCFGSNTQTQSCSVNKCPVDGGFTQWSSWTACSLSCAGGTQSRTRSCTKPSPQYGGAQCSGATFDTQSCNTQACPLVEFGQPCTTNGDKCRGENTACTGGTCKCVSGYFRNGNACIPKIELGQSGCSTTVSDSCRSTDATCQSPGGSCRCNTGYYDDNGNTNGGTCRIRIELGSSGCSIAVTDSCKSPAATCQSHGGSCTCNTGYYDNNGNTYGGTCRIKIELGSSGCSTAVTDSCKSTYATCQSNGYCTCDTGYYDDNGNNAGGTCRRKIELGSSGCSTTVSDSCMSPAATCQSNRGSCTCDSGYFDDNGNNNGGGRCRIKIELGQSGCSQSVTDSCKSPDATCQSHGGSCTCDTGYYDNNGGQVGGTCTIRKNLGKQCTNLPNECATTNAECLDNKCTCSSNFYDTNGYDDDGSCASLAELRVKSISFSEITTSGFTVSWTPPSSTAQINNYEVVWRLKTTDSSLNGGNSVVPKSSTSFTISTGVTAGKTYTVNVKSVNTDTRKDYPRSTSLSKEQASKPNKPRSLTTSDLDARDKYITVGWSAPSIGVATYFRIQLLDDKTLLTRKDVSSTTAKIYYQNIKNGYRYDVKISARSEVYQNSLYEWSDVYVQQITTTVQIPSAPRSVECDILKDESITLKWQKPEFPNGDLVRYNIEVFNNTGKYSSYSTGEVVEIFQVLKLSPGTTYRFRVYTQNTMYNSTAYGESPSCSTKDKLSDPPNDFQATDVTSRKVSIKWKEPVNSYSEEIIGYVIQLKKEDTCVEEIVYKCSSCRTTLEPSNLENMCDSSVRNVISVTKTELEGVQQSRSFSNLLPDTTYTVLGAAVNSLGDGNTAEISVTTAEEVLAPQKPYDVQVKNIKTTSLTVTWNIPEPRPGKTNYTINLNADQPAQSKEIKVTGFNVREYTASGLQEYWNYSVIVTASTSIGSSKSTVTDKYRTLPAAPGKVSKFMIEYNPGGDYTKMRISWKMPTVLERNGVITNYRLKYFATGMVTSTMKFDQESVDYLYSVIIDVKPEEIYSITVYAINGDGIEGEKHIVIEETPAGVPPNYERKENRSIVSLTTVQTIQKTQFTVKIVEDFFTNDTYGAIRTSGIVLCKKKDCDISRIKTKTDFDYVDNINTNKNMFRSTREDWLIKLKQGQLVKGSEKCSANEFEYIFGVEDCSKRDLDEYCNGPLQPGTTYFIFGVVCTNGGCLISQPNGPFVTNTAQVTEECNCSTQSIVIGVVLGFIILLLIVFSGYLIFKIRRIQAKDVNEGNNAVMKAHISQIYVNETFSAGASDVPTQQERASGDPETEYSTLDDKSRDGTTYEKLRPGH